MAKLLPRMMIIQKTKTMARMMKSQEMMMKQKPRKRLPLAASQTRRSLLPKQALSEPPQKQLPQPSRTLFLKHKLQLQMPKLTLLPRR